MVFQCPSRLNHVKGPDVLIINHLADDNRSNETYGVAGRMKGTLCHRIKTKISADRVNCCSISRLLQGEVGENGVEVEVRTFFATLAGAEFTVISRGGK